MTLEEEYDRWERYAKLLCVDSLRASRESRKQTARLRSYVDAQREYEVTKLAVAAKPDDSETNETLCRAREILKTCSRRTQTLNRKSTTSPSCMM
jgi:hypothetical protein